MKLTRLPRRLLCVAMLAFPTPSVPEDGPFGLRLLGAGEMRWFGVTLYQAQLWTEGGQFDPAADFALKLTYARDFSREQLVNSSLQEMRRLTGADEASLTRWREELARVLPDVRRNQSLIGRHQPGRGMSVFHEGGSSGEIRDPELARAFFAIWLDPRTREPELRARLIGARR